MLMINGEPHPEAVGSSMMSFLETNNYKIKFVAVECNGDILPKTEFANKILTESDTLEVVSFVGGG